MFTAQDQLVQVKLSRLQAEVGLYQALGGGWTESEDLKTQRVSALDASARQDSGCPSDINSEVDDARTQVKLVACRRELRRGLPATAQRPKRSHRGARSIGAIDVEVIASR